MKQQIIYIGGGEAKENYKNFEFYLKNLKLDLFPIKKQRWNRYLQEDFGEDFEIINVPIPLRHFADYFQWKIIFEKVLPYIQDGAIFLGHSLGGTFLVKYFNEEQIDFSFKKIFLLAPAFKDCPNETIGSFNFDHKLENLQEFSEKITILHSKDDFVVPYEDFEDFQKAIPSAQFVSFDNKNHFLDRDFPELLDIIKKL